MAATTALCEALNQGISSGNLVDTKIIVFSHRDSSGRVCQPKALYANSRVLKTVPYFSDLLFGDFAESQSKDFKESIDEDESAEDYGYLSDSDLEDDEDEKVSSFKHPTKSTVHPFRDLFSIPGEDKVVCEDHEECVEKGKVVKIPDMAFVTFQAFLMYLYTDMIEFAPFGSEENRKSRSAEIVNLSDDKVPRPSPKSIYRLADKYDVPALKTLALNHIRGELGKCDIVEESFSRFAFRYEEIRNLYIQQLAFIWMEDATTESTRTNVDKKIDSFVEGDLEYATEILSELWEIANKDGEVKAPSSTVPAIIQAISPGHWASVKTALIRSIREGVFFDKKYWSRHSKTGNTLKPIYISGTIMSDKVQQLSKLVKYLKGRNSLVRNPDGDICTESDCEGEARAEDESSNMKEEEEEKARAVLITGSFATWKSLFFYRCTDVISFAPLKSQGIEARLKYIRENTVETAPPPCSPKTIYVLASLLGMQPLCDSAFADIQSKLSSDNIVDEVFSWVTASKEKIREMQCELLISTFQDAQTIARVKENIVHVSDGSLSHCGGPLKLGLKKAFEFKKTKTSVKLRCGYPHCQYRTSPPSYSSIPSNNYCPNGCGYWMECIGCGRQRTGSFASCQGCGKRFI